MNGAPTYVIIFFCLVISKLDKWQVEMAGLEGWLEEVDVFVCAETMAVGDADFLEAQLEQSTVSKNKMFLQNHHKLSLCSFSGIAE